MKIRDYISTIVIFILFSNTSFAVERAPRISDREIIESLTELKVGQKSIHERFEQVDKRFEQMDKRFEMLITQMDKKFEQVDKRFDRMSDQIDKRLDDSMSTNKMFFGFLFSIILFLFGFMVWDRRTLMKPLEGKIINMEQEFEIGSEHGNKISRLINASKKLSEDDQRTANVLRQFHLL